MEKKILIVDDMAESLKVTCHIIEAQNYDVLCAETADDASDIFDAERPFLVITDLRLKNHIDGATLADRLHRRDPLCIFIAISGYIGSFDLGYLLGAVFTDVLVKPFDMDDLIKIVNYAWEKRQRWEKMRT